MPRIQPGQSPFVLGLIIALAVGVRMVHLNADTHFIVDRGVVYDAGEYQKNARQQVQFGAWRFDDYNPELAMAPVHTAILTGVYSAFGIGYWQASLPQAVAGVLTCLLVYGLARRGLDEPTARLALLVQATSLIAVGYDRTGLVESLQLLFVLAMIYFGLRALDRPGFGVVGGISAAASILTKPTALFMGPVLALGWLGRWFDERRAAPPKRFRWAGLLVFAIATAIALGLVVGIVLVPLLPDIKRFLALSEGGVFDEGSRALQYVRTRLFGLSLLGMSVNGFFKGTIGLQIVVAWFGARRVLGQVDDRVTEVERIAWIWLGLGLLFLSLQHYQPDRRFLLFVPPLALLAAVAVRATARSAEPSRRSFIVAGFLIGGVLGFLLGWPLGPLVRTALGEVFGRDVSLSAARSVLWSGFALAVPIAALVARRGFGRVVAKLPLGVVLAVTVAIDLGQLVVYLARPSYTLEAASHSLDRLTADWPASRRIIFGGEANTLAIATRLVGFGQSPAKGDWISFNPTLVTLTLFNGAPPDSALPNHPSFRLCRVLHFGPVVRGRRRHDVALYAAGDYLDRCRAWAAAEDATGSRD